LVSVRSIISGVGVVVVIAIIFVALMGFIASVFADLFPDVANPFQTVYGMVRALVLFMIVFPTTFGLISLAFFGDLFIVIICPLINGIFDISTITSGINLPTEAFIMDQVVGTEAAMVRGRWVAGQKGLITTITELVETLYPKTIA